MAQHPRKLEWMERIPYGLSASQFSQAMGFHGRVIDYVKFRREVVGTAQEFVGNASTLHGNRVEPKSRALYEMLTGVQVYPGGFFTAEDQLLACSPDGQTFYYDDDDDSGGGKLRTVGDMDETVTPRRRDEAGQGGLGHSTRQRRLRLLEIKSPVHKLYDAVKEVNHPFGIPQYYMCQIQGQMALAGAIECDFFVFLDIPDACQVEAWRVRRSDAFWAWAEPKLRRVIAWILDGPPPWLDRSFAFEPFDFDSIIVEPLVFPFDIRAGCALTDARRFPFFHRFASPYDLSGAPVSSRSAAIAKMSAHPALRFLFASAGGMATGAAADAAALASGGCRVAGRTFILSCSPPGAARVTWNTLHDNLATARADGAMTAREVMLIQPADWEAGIVDVYVLSETASTQPSPMLVHAVRTYNRAFFAALVLPPTSIEQSVDPTLLAHAECNRLLQIVVADATGDVARQSDDTLPRTGTCTPPPDLLTQLQQQRNTVTPARHDKRVSLSQRLRQSMTPHRTPDSTRQRPQAWSPSPVAPFRAELYAASDEDGRGEEDVALAQVAPSLTSSGEAPLVLAIDRADLLRLLQYAEDCEEVLLLHSLEEAVEHFVYNIDPAPDALSGTEDACGYTMLLAPGAVLEQLVQCGVHGEVGLQCCYGGDDGGVRVRSWHRSVLVVARRLASLLPPPPCETGADVTLVEQPERFVLCYIEDGKSHGGADRPLRRDAPLTPCFVVCDDDCADLLHRARDVLAAHHT